jgi:DNA-binding IscR family transcriptional regulator
MKEVRDAIVNILESITVAELCDRVRRLEAVPDGPPDYAI